MVGVRVAMFVKLCDVLELLVAYSAIERSKGFADFGLDIRSASDAVLFFCSESERTPRTTGARYLSFRALVFALFEEPLRSQFAAL
jgi:hypothetical protein